MGKRVHQSAHSQLIALKLVRWQRRMGQIQQVRQDAARLGTTNIIRKINADDLVFVRKAWG